MYCINGLIWNYFPWFITQRPPPWPSIYCKSWYYLWELWFVKTWDKSCPFPELSQHHHQSLSPLYRILLNLHTEHSNKFCWLPPQSQLPSKLLQSEEVQISEHFLLTLSLEVRQGEEQREESSAAWQGDTEEEEAQVWQIRWSQDSQAVRRQLAGLAGIAGIFDQRKDFDGKIRKEKSVA